MAMARALYVTGARAAALVAEAVARGTGRIGTGAGAGAGTATSTKANVAPLLQVNPGQGQLTQHLLKLHPCPSRLLLFEQDPKYQPQLENLQSNYPNILDYYIADFFGMWKLAFQDKMDNGSRIENLFRDFIPKPWGSDISMTVVGAVPSADFIKHLLTSIVFQNSIITMGRPEFYLSMMPLDYYSLVFDDMANTPTIFHFRPTPVLFNLLFDHKLLVKLPREDFSPQTTVNKINSKNKTKIKLANIDKDSLYLVHISPKEILPCRTEHLPLLWYFFKHHLLSKSNRIIPMLEQWIPGCGVWLITGQDPPGTNIEIGPDESNAKLPHITIFTQFSDLNPQQKLTLFKKFISWPEFEQSPFKETLENHIYKSYSRVYKDAKLENIENDEIANLQTEAA